MRAAVFLGPGELLQLQDLPDPEPGPGEVVLRIVRCGICATDLHMTEDSPFAAPPGFVAGHERGAEVVAVGAGVTRLRAGDHVVPHHTQGCGQCIECVSGTPYFCAQAQMKMGGFAQYMVCAENICAKLPASLPLADAALIEPLTVGLHAAELTRIEIGAKVVVLGAGPMGLAAVFWARRMGAGKIVVVARSRLREAIARAIGVDSFLTSGDDLRGELAEILGGAPDVVLECTGMPGTIAQGAELVRPRGTVTVVGMCTHADPWVPAVAMLKELRIQFVVGTSLGQFLQVADVLSAGHVEPRHMITDTISLEKLPQTFESLRTSSVQCKVMVDPWMT
jgi:(R,R)-butanediol dehydrogenase/meso-butanediol dehydrogenase/diacetyl reductase